jgi:DnaK suppressor protein
MKKQLRCNRAAVCEVSVMEKKKQRGRRRPRASTDQVLGPAPLGEKIRAKWKHHYKRLLELRDSLLRRQSDLSKDAAEETPNFSLHMADAGTDTYDRDFALGMLSSEQDAAYEVEQALDRVRSGSYGKCELTGKPIEPERLEAVPWTRFSAAAERQLERQGAMKRAGLGPRETVGREANSRAGVEETE